MGNPKTSEIKEQKPRKERHRRTDEELEKRMVEMKHRQKSKPTNKNVQWLFYNISQYQTQCVPGLSWG
jgi:hypothetical protein